MRGFECRMTGWDIRQDGEGEKIDPQDIVQALSGGDWHEILVFELGSQH